MAARKKPRRDGPDPAAIDVLAYLAGISHSLEKFIGVRNGKNQETLYGFLLIQSADTPTGGDSLSIRHSHRIFSRALSVT